MASPYESHASGDLQRAWSDSLWRMIRMCETFDVPPILTHYWGDRSPGIWSPVVEGHVRLGADFPRQRALTWCLDRLRCGNFDTLIISNLPRRPEPNGMDLERQMAERLGMQIIVEC